jgi:hypothetical protein
MGKTTRKYRYSTRSKVSKPYTCTLLPSPDDQTAAAFIGSHYFDMMLYHSNPKVVKPYTFESNTLPQSFQTTRTAAAYCLHITDMMLPVTFISLWQIDDTTHAKTVIIRHFQRNNPGDNLLWVCSFRAMDSPTCLPQRDGPQFQTTSASLLGRWPQKLPIGTSENHPEVIIPVFASRNQQLRMWLASSSVSLVFLGGSVPFGLRITYCPNKPQCADSTWHQVQKQNEI